MKRCAVDGRTHTVVIPVMPEFRWEEPDDPSALVDVQYRYVHLEPRKIDGRIVFAAYDQETDTLYIQAD